MLKIILSLLLAAGVVSVASVADARTCTTTCFGNTCTTTCY